MPDSAKMTPDADILEDLAPLLRAIHGAGNIDDLRTVLNTAVAPHLGADRITLYSMDEKWHELWTIPEGAAEVRFPSGRGIAGWVAKNNAPYSSSDPEGDDLYVEEIDSVKGPAPGAIVSAPMTDSRGRVTGVLQISFAQEDMSGDEERLLALLAGHLGMAIERLKATAAQERYARSMAEAFSRAVGAMHASTINHGERVRGLALAMGREAGLAAERLRELEMAALLCNVGLMEFPEAESEETLANQIYFTNAVLKNVSFPPELSRVPQICLEYMERFDGTGSPGKKRGEKILLEARILGLADRYSRWLTQGIGGKHPSEQEILATVKASANTLFDPKIVALFLDKKLHNAELRRYQRIEYSTPMDVTPLGSRMDAFAAEVEDISEGGVLFSCDRALGLHSVLKILLHLPAGKVEAIGKVVRVSPAGGRFKIALHLMWHGPADQR